MGSNGIAAPKFVQPRLVHRLAQRYAPILVQEVRALYDFIVPIHLGDFDPQLIEKPTIYCTVRTGGGRHYALYCIFHRRDWSTLPWPIKQLDEHEYDFEGVLRVFDIKTGHFVWSASIFHHDILFEESPHVDAPVYIESAGHGIVLSRHAAKGTGLFSATHCQMVYRPGLGEIDLVDMSDPEHLQEFREEIQPAFNACRVHLPWQWDDAKLLASHGEGTRGLIWTNPALLGDLAVQTGRFR